MSRGQNQAGIGHSTHTTAQREALAKARKEFFDEVYGGRNIELLLLGTHPEYQHRGAASNLVRCGMGMASEMRRLVL
jgi:ribosomal protein S18 acetylase RimI-like enzyme